jgi:hypothetical protein
MRCARQQASSRPAAPSQVLGSAPLHPETLRVEFDKKTAVAGFAGSRTRFSLADSDLFFQ